MTDPRPNFLPAPTFLVKWKWKTTDVVPVGSIVAYTPSDKEIPEGWIVLEHGRKIPKKYVVLRKVIGERFPDLRGHTR